MDSAAPLPATLDRADLDRVVRAAVARYIASRRALVGPFVDRHFSVRGTFRLHRHALGWDILKAPANLALGLPHAAVQLAGSAASRLGARRLGTALARRNLMLETAVGRALERAVMVELLERPLEPGGRDAFAEEILQDPELESVLLRLLAPAGARAGEAGFRESLEATLGAYSRSRPAAAEIATALVSLGVGALALDKLTPGALTLGPALAGSLAQSAAVAAFPLGSSLGGLWYAAFPASAPAALTVGVTGGLMAGAALVAAFAGLVTDPVQRRLGLHARRLNRLLDALERQWSGPEAPGLTLRDHYVSRLVDLLDLAAAAWRLARR